MISAIFGLITKRARAEGEAELARMARAMRRDGLAVATRIDESIGIYLESLGLHGSAEDGVLLRSATGDFLLAIAGEDYSGPSADSALHNQYLPEGFKSRSYLVRLEEEHASLPKMLNGRFHGVLVDRKRGSVMLFNDRYGMHRLYYHESSDAFYFASEAKAILAVCPHTRRLDDRSLGEFVSCGAVLENRTLFRGIYALPPASSWTFRNGMLERKISYFQPKEWEEQEPLDAEAFYQELRACFVRNLPRYFSGGQPIGMSLTGGLDTRMILANHNPESGSLPCYTFGSMFRENQDVRVARKVAEVCHQPFQVLAAGQTFLSKFPSYAERTVYLTDGCADVSRAPDLFLNEGARDIAPVRMTGLYGGELLRGVRTFRPAKAQAQFFAPGLSPWIHQAVNTYNEISRCHPVSFAAFRQGPWHLRSSLALEQTQLTMRTPYLDNDLVRTVFRAPASALEGNKLSLRLIADGNRALLDIPTDRGVGGKRNGLSASASHAVLEFLFKAEYAYDSGMPHWLARIDHALAPLHLERAFLGRHKPFHFRIWYRDTLAWYVREMLLDSRSLARPYLEKKSAENIVREHLRGTQNHTYEIHKLLTLELIHRLFVDAGSAIDVSSEVLNLRMSLSETR